MARWTQPHEVGEYGRVAHAFTDANKSMNLLVIDRRGAHHAGRLTGANMSQDPHCFPPVYAGEFTLEDERGVKRTFDLLDVQDVYPQFTPPEAAAQIP